MNRQGAILSAGADLDRSERFEIADPISSFRNFRLDLHMALDLVSNLLN